MTGAIIATVAWLVGGLGIQFLIGMFGVGTFALAMDAKRAEVQGKLGRRSCLMVLTGFVWGIVWISGFLISLFNWIHLAAIGAS